jgi:hypothetical protein
MGQLISVQGMFATIVCQFRVSGNMTSIDGRSGTDNLEDAGSRELAAQAHALYAIYFFGINQGKDSSGGGIHGNEAYHRGLGTVDPFQHITLEPPVQAGFQGKRSVGTMKINLPSRVPEQIVRIYQGPKVLFREQA